MTGKHTSGHTTVHFLKLHAASATTEHSNAVRCAQNKKDGLTTKVDQQRSEEISCNHCKARVRDPVVHVSF